MEENSNTYFLDPESVTEMVRLIQQDRLATQGMGGPLAGLPDPSALRHILDIACGPGGWALDVAFACPSAEVVGIDISQGMINYAISRTETQGLSNVSFEVMDISKPIEFSDTYFDFVNARFLIGVLRRESWSPLIAECTRMLRPGGILRLTEMVEAISTNSAAYERLNALLFQAMWRVGYGFSPDGRTLDMTFMLPRLLRLADYQNIQCAAHVLEYGAGTAHWADFYRQAESGHYMTQPLLIKMGVATQEELNELYQQMLAELKREDFCGMWHYVTVWGTKPV